MLLVKDGDFRRDEESEASIQTLKEQAKNKTAGNPKHNGKDSHRRQQYLKVKREERGRTAGHRAEEQGGTAGSRARATSVKIDRHRNKVQDHSFTDKYLTGRTRPGDYAARHAGPSEGLDGEEKERQKVDNGEDIQEVRVFIANLPPALPPEEHREEATRDQVHQRLKEARVHG